MLTLFILIILQETFWLHIFFNSLIAFIIYYCLSYLKKALGNALS